MGVTSLLLYHAARTIQKGIGRSFRNRPLKPNVQELAGPTLPANSVAARFPLGADRKRHQYPGADWGVYRQRKMYRLRVDLVLAIVSLLGIGTMIQACGQKGDLYLPEPKKETPKQTATSIKTEPAPTPEAPGSRMSR
jgi:predicted small lipoprotein YifL